MVPRRKLLYGPFPFVTKPRCAFSGFASFPVPVQCASDHLPQNSFQSSGNASVPHFHASETLRFRQHPNDRPPICADASVCVPDDAATLNLTQNGLIAAE